MNAREQKNTQREALDSSESILEIDEDMGPDAAEEPSLLQDGLNETMQLEGSKRPHSADRPADITPRGKRAEAEVGVSFQSDQELMNEYQEKALEDRRLKNLG